VGFGLAFLLAESYANEAFYRSFKLKVYVFPFSNTFMPGEWAWSIAYFNSFKLTLYDFSNFGNSCFCYSFLNMSPITLEL